MNKQEAIERINILKELSHGALGGDWIELGIDKALDVVKQLDDAVKPPKPKPLVPEKPVVPQYVAEFIASEQRSCSTLSEAIDNMDMMDDRGGTSWFYDNSEIFAKAWLYGYEIEKEKLYTVEIPNSNGDGYGVVYLGRNEYNKIELRIWDCYSSIEFADNWKQEENAQLTESEIKQDFGWAWQFAKEVKE